MFQPATEAGHIFGQVFLGDAPIKEWFDFLARNEPTEPAKKNKEPMLSWLAFLLVVKHFFQTIKQKNDLPEKSRQELEQIFLAAGDLTAANAQELSFALRTKLYHLELPLASPLEPLGDDEPSGPYQQEATRILDNWTPALPLEDGLEGR